ncbi:MAG: inositol monophosphatase [Chloroflexota bacterium]|nr:inositol monophosphatase [Chloroflexota bacterium]
MDDAEAIEVAGRAAFRGGRVALARLGEPGYVRWKGHRDIAAGSAVDVQEAILAVLRKECPDDAILAEEGPEDEALDVDAERLWIVDPICGSQNFVQGIPFFAVSIALRVGGQLRAGVVYDPVRDERFAATLGGQATLNDRPIAVRATAEGPEFWEKSWVATDLPPGDERRDEAYEAFEIISSDVTSHRVLGSPALSICYVAAGRLHAYWTLDAKPWDVAAAAVVLESAGGVITDADGGSWIHSDGGYVAANPTLHKSCLGRVAHVRERHGRLRPRTSGARGGAAPGA